MLFFYRAMVAAITIALRTGTLAPEPPFRALAQMTGADSSVEIPRVTVVSTQSDWAQLWSEHHSTFKVGISTNAQDDDADRPKVQLDGNVVVCIFGGQSKNVGGFTVVQVTNDAKSAYLRIAPQLIPSTGAAILENPFIFVVVPKTKRKLIVQLDQSDLGGAGWRTLANLPATKQ